MAEDIRIKVSFYKHIKRRKLQKRLGAEGVLALIDLWLYAGENKTTGRLDGMTREDIAMAAEWTGDQDNLVDTLKDLGFLEEDAGTFVIHDWINNNGYVAHAHERSEKAKRAASARWEKRLDTGKGCSEHDRALPGAQPSIAKPDSSNAPYPNPNPNPNPNPKPKEYVADETATKLAGILFDQIVKENPDSRLTAATPASKDATIAKWAKDFDLLIRKDGKAPKDIATVIRWATADPFWKPNILSGAKVREKWDTLILQARKGAKANGNGNGTGGHGKDTLGDGQPYPVDAVCTE